jgi:hypothetical protein
MKKSSKNFTDPTLENSLAYNPVKNNIYSFLENPDALKLRQTAKIASTDLVEYNSDKPIRGSLKNWRKTFPNALRANLSGRRDLTDSDFQYLVGIKYLDISYCSSISDAAFKYLEGIHTLNMSLLPGHGY